MPDFADPKNVVALSSVIAAVVAGLCSLIGVLLTQRKTRQTQEVITRLQSEQATVLETIRARLGEEKDERAARRDYEYDARKRLYEQCDPLLFQFIELSENASGRIINMAEVCRGDLHLKPDGTGWLDYEGYYFLTTMYRLMVPCVVFELLQRRLTLLDLRLDGRIGTQFTLSRMLYRTFRNDWDLAQTDPLLPYNPDHKDAARLRVEQPAVYHRQGIYGGHLDAAIDALVLTKKGQPSRFLRYVEFSSAYATNGSKVQRAFEPVARLFSRFHPATRPVLWRVLLAQTCIYRAVQISKGLDSPYRDGGEALRAVLAHSAEWPDWAPPSETRHPRLDERPADAVKRYLESAAERMSATTA